MATPEPGKLYQPSGADEIAQDFLDDLYLQAVANGNPAPPTQPGTDWYALAIAVANAQLIQYANIAIADDNSDLRSATGDSLESKRIGYGLPEVQPSPSTGKIRVRVNGTATVPDGRQLTLPNGLRLKVSGTQTVSDKSEIDVIAIDTGTATNATGGTEVKFISPPLNVQEKATVSNAFPLTGGVDSESDAQKKQRILDRLRYQPGGGNWAGLRDLAKTTLASLQDAYVYPALGGPGSVKVALVKSYDPDNLDFSRAPNAAQVAYVRAALQANNASESEIVVQAVADQDAAVTLQVTLPASTLSGGNGNGWSDSAPWPQLAVADGGKVVVSASINPTYVRVNAHTTTLPIAGQTRIAWFSQADKQFRVYTVTALPGSAVSGNYELQVDRPMADSAGNHPQAGDVICPAAEHILDYGAAWLKIMNQLGPGENTADSNRLPRSLRHPYVTTGPDSSLTFTLLRQLADQFPEITSAAYAYRNLTSPDVPATIDAAPNILRLYVFGIYPA